MFRPIAAESEPIILVGNGQAAPSEVHFAREFGQIVVAADGGAALALEAGIVPQAVIGDFDSLGDDVLARLPKDRLFRVRDQDSTDLQKCLARIDAPAVLAVGFMGGRLDHQLAAFSAALADPRPVILIGAEEISVLVRKELSLALEPGSPVALYPLLAARVRTRGLRWDVDGLMAPDGLIATSNEMEASLLEVNVSGDGILLMVPRASLGALLGALGL